MDLDAGWHSCFSFWCLYLVLNSLLPFRSHSSGFLSHRRIPGIHIRVCGMPLIVLGMSSKDKESASIEKAQSCISRGLFSSVKQVLYNSYPDRDRNGLLDEGSPLLLIEPGLRPSSKNLSFVTLGSTIAAVNISSTLLISRKTEPTAPVSTGAGTEDVANGATKDAGEGTQLTVLLKDPTGNLLWSILLISGSLSQDDFEDTFLHMWNSCDKRSLQTEVEWSVRVGSIIRFGERVESGINKVGLNDQSRPKLQVGLERKESLRSSRHKRTRYSWLSFLSTELTFILDYGNNRTIL
ncbi:hypothetical protein Dimus_003359 [Dionaea muscipula]